MTEAFLKVKKNRDLLLKDKIKARVIWLYSLLDSHILLYLKIYN